MGDSSEVVLRLFLAALISAFLSIIGMGLVSPENALLPLAAYFYLTIAYFTYKALGEDHGG